MTALRRARSVDPDRFIPPFLLDSAISRAGMRYLTVIGALWGAIWSTGRVERDGDLWVFQGMPRWTYRRGGTCVGRCYLTGDEPVTEAVLRHEHIHVEQQRRYGILFPLLYALAGRDALANRFEIEAGLEDGNYL